MARRRPAWVGPDGVEGDAALQQREQAVDVERGAAAAELDREAAGVPEAGAVGHPDFWFGALMKRSISTSPASVSSMSSTWPTWMRLKSTGAPIAHRAAVGRAELHPEAGGAGGGQRRARQALEELLARAGAVVPAGADVDAGDHRLDAGDALGGDGGADHPELGVGVEEVRHVLVDAGGDDHALEVGGEVELLDHADQRRRGSGPWSGRPRRRRRCRRRSRSVGPRSE